MIRKVIFTAVCGTMLAVSGLAHAAPRELELPDETAEFKPSANPGYEVTQDNCAACHSADYINYQPPGKGEAFWEGEVHKMINTFHAPVTEDDAKLIVGYLSATY